MQRANSKLSVCLPWLFGEMALVVIMVASFRMHHAVRAPQGVFRS